MAEILEFPAKEPAARITRTDEYIEISGDFYEVHRTTDGRGGGWLTITDPRGRQILVLPARIEANVLPHVIIAYRVGRSAGEADERAREQPL